MAAGGDHATWHRVPEQILTSQKRNRVIFVAASQAVCQKDSSMAQHRWSYLCNNKVTGPLAFQVSADFAARALIHKPGDMANAQQKPAISSTKHYYTQRYHSDPEFRAQEKARTAEKVRANYARYQQLWREAYLRRKARNKQACVHPIQNIPYPKLCDSIAHGAANSNSHG